MLVMEGCISMWPVRSRVFLNYQDVIRSYLRYLFILGHLREVGCKLIKSGGQKVLKKRFKIPFIPKKRRLKEDVNSL